MNGHIFLPKNQKPFCTLTNHICSVVQLKMVDMKSPFQSTNYIFRIEIVMRTELGSFTPFYILWCECHLMMVHVGIQDISKVWSNLYVWLELTLVNATFGSGKKLCWPKIVLTKLRLTWLLYFHFMWISRNVKSW